MSALDIPDACKDDANTIELLSIWHIGSKYITSIRFNFFHENDINESIAWGQVLADTVDKVLARDAQSQSLPKVLELVRRELDNPTTARDGKFA
jgi:hypothetical protein